MATAWLPPDGGLAGADWATGAGVLRIGPACCWLPRIHPMIKPNSVPAMPKTMASALIAKFQNTTRGDRPSAFAKLPPSQMLRRTAVALAEAGQVCRNRRIDKPKGLSPRCP